MPKPVPDMRNATARYDVSSVAPYAIFFLSLLLSIIVRTPWLMAIPFVWVLAPSLFNSITRHASRIFWLMLIMLPLSSEINFTPSLGMDMPDELLLILLTAMMVVKLVHEPKWFPRSVSIHPLFLLLVMHLVWLLITCFYSQDPWLSVKYLLAKTWYILPLVILPQRLIQNDRSWRTLALCLLLPMLFVVIQTLARHALYGFSFADIKHIFSPFFRNHVNYSSMLVCLLAVAWCTWKLTPEENPRRKWLLYGMSVGLIALVFSYSRGAWLALLSGIIGAYLIRKRWIGIALAIALLAAVAGIAWLSTDHQYMAFRPVHDKTVFHTDFSEHISATLKGRDISNAERMYRWIAGARMVAEKPVTGFGPNTFYSQYRPYTVSSFETWVSNNPEHSTVHNYFLLTAIEQGWPGLVLFGLLFAGMLLYTQYLYHHSSDTFYTTIALTIGAILIMIAVINCLSDMIETDKIGGIFWLCLGGIIFISSRLSHPSTHSPKG
jgi:O-antigen ligase